MSGFVLLDLGF